LTTLLNSKTITYEELAKTIDHSLLNPDMDEDTVIAGCQLAKKYNVASVCVKPYHVKMAVEQLKGSDVKVGTVVGFPHGSSTTETKVFEARDAIANGATELDMVLNIGELKSGNADYVRQDIAAVVSAAEGKAHVHRLCARGRDDRRPYIDASKRGSPGAGKGRRRSKVAGCDPGCD
jgi:deoxyribose-phosphate aldolase